MVWLVSKFCRKNEYDVMIPCLENHSKITDERWTFLGFGSLFVTSSSNNVITESMNRYVLP